MNESLARLDGRTVVGLTIWGEARGEPVEGKIGVGAVIRNRVRTLYRGGAYHEVCLAPKQFSCWNASDANRPKLLAFAERLAMQHVPDDAVLRECLFLALGIVTEQITDNTRGARHYHARGAQPAWADGRMPVVVLGHHLFFMGIP